MRSAIAVKVDPGLVDVNVTLGYQDDGAAATGMVLTASGEVLTNNHVIDGATQINVVDLGTHEAYNATVVGYDVRADIAVLQLQGASGLATVSFGNSSDVVGGQQVVGIGNAGGAGGTPSVVTGWVTGLHQAITAVDQESGTAEQLAGLIKTNAAIEAGDSGSPLLDAQGKVIGMTTAASSGYSLSSYSSAGYAIPANTAHAIAGQIARGRGSQSVHIGLTAFLGAQVTARNELGAPSGERSGDVVVTGITPGGPAEKAGLSVGDVVVSLDDSNIVSSNQLAALLQADHPGDKHKIAWRDAFGVAHVASLTLADGPPA